MMKHAWIPGCLLWVTAPMMAQTTYLSENFDAGMPAGWTVTVPTCGNSSGDSTRWMTTSGGWRGQGLAAYSLDSTEFAVIDSDLPGAFCLSEDFLTSPAVNPSSSPTVYLDFDHHYKHSLVGSAAVEVFDGATWVVVAPFTVTTGAWLNPDHVTIDVSQYNNPNFRVRFRYQANWDWFWAVDNVKVYEPNPTSLAEIPQYRGGLFPNPASERITIQLPWKNEETTRLSVYDLAGCARIAILVVTPEPVLDIGRLPDGVYVVEVRSGQGVFRRRFVKGK